MSSQTPNINPVNNVVDIDLPLEGTKIRFGKDDNRMVTVNLSDFNLISRMNEAYPKLGKLAERVTELADVKGETLEQSMDNMSKLFTEIDAEMRELVNFIFDADVSSAALPNGNMYSLCNGSYAFEIILETVLKLCTEQYQVEFDKMKKKVGKHTDKYTRKKR